MRVAVHYAVEREEQDKNPFHNVKEDVDNPKEKDVLSHDERTKLINAEPTDHYSRLAAPLDLPLRHEVG
jgi:hypothetical protein